MCVVYISDQDLQFLKKVISTNITNNGKQDEFIIILNVVKIISLIPTRPENLFNV